MVAITEQGKRAVERRLRHWVDIPTAPGEPGDWFMGAMLWCQKHCPRSAWACHSRIDDTEGAPIQNRFCFKDAEMAERFRRAWPKERRDNVRLEWPTLYDAYLLKLG